MVYLAVSLGGFLGSCIRYLLGEWFGTYYGFPLTTLIINIIGSFVLAWFYTLTLERLPIHPHIRTGIGTGLIGSFTTFSTFSIDSWKLYQSGEYLYALLYVLLTLGLGLLFAWFGYRSGRFLAGYRNPAPVRPVR